MDRRQALLLFGAAGLGVTGCSGPAEPSPTPTPPPAPTPTPTPSAPPPPPAIPRWPLTGVPLTDAAAAAHAAVAVKVPDNRNEHPQVGINDADIVFVQLEGYPDARGESATRLMPVYHSRFPRNVAPVRSSRPVDAPLLAPMRAMIASTGSSGWVEAYLSSFGAFIDASRTYLKARSTGAYSIDQNRVRQYKGETYYDRAVVAHPEKLASLAGEAQRGGPQQPFFPWAATDADISTLQGQPATMVKVPWKSGASYDMTYTFDAGSGLYQRSMPWGPHVEMGGARVTTDNVLVIRANQRVAKLYPGDGGEDPVHDIIDAQGSFVYARGGRAVTGTWAKGAVDAPFTFTVADGRPLALGPGRTFVELPNRDADVRLS